MVWRYGRAIRSLSLSFAAVLFNGSMAAAYHGTHGSTRPLAESLSPTELGLFYVAPLAAVSTLLYPLTKQWLADRYARDSALNPDPEDMQIYAAGLSGGTALVLTLVAAIALGSRVGHTVYAAGVAIVFVAAAFLNRRWLRERVTL